jgi:hypothetical protein
MLDFLFLAGQAASALLLLHGGCLVGCSLLADWFERAPQVGVPGTSANASAL